MGKQAYWIILSIKYAKMYDVFPVFLLEEWKDCSTVVDTLLLSDFIDDEEEWKMKDIVEYQEEGDNRRYFVK